MRKASSDTVVESKCSQIETGKSPQWWRRAFGLMVLLAASHTSQLACPGFSLTADPGKLVDPLCNFGGTRLCLSPVTRFASFPFLTLWRLTMQCVPTIHSVASVQGCILDGRATLTLRSLDLNDISLLKYTHSFGRNRVFSIAR